MSECALWYWQYSTLCVEVCETEQEAASRAVAMNEYGEAAPDGVSFPDGRALRREEWSAYKDEQRARDERDQAAARDYVPGPKPVLVEVPYPFKAGKTASVENPPTWLRVGPVGLEPTPRAL